jgi:hypothetical protein
LNRERVSLVYARHVLEHVDDPIAIAQLIQKLNAPLYLEVPTFEWIASNCAFYDLFNEHCSLFTQPSMHAMLERLDLDRAARITTRFGGQYLSIAIDDSRSRETVPTAESRWSPDDVARALSLAREQWRIRITRLRRAGPVLIWGAGAKGVSFLNALELHCDIVPCVIDINPLKHSRYVPITGQQVIAPEMIHNAVHGDAPTIIVMNPAYTSEIGRLMNQLKIDATLETINDRSAPLEVHC